MPPPTSSQISNMVVFGDRAFKGVIKVKRSHESAILIPQDCVLKVEIEIPQSSVSMPT